LAVRVLIVDDSTFFRRQITRLLENKKEFEIIGTATNGTEALSKTLELKPDVITMDIEMPVMNGIDATKNIMRQIPTPILIFSSLSTDGAKLTLDALDAGAVDYMPKKLQDISANPDEVTEVLCKKIIAVARQSRILLQKEKAAFSAKSEIPKRARKVSNSTKIVAIGTSTGGPVALQSVLKDIPFDFPLPILLIQHMPGTFTPAFASRLNDLCHIKVKEAEDGDELKPGVAYLAPGGKQMGVKGTASSARLEIIAGDASLNYKPSVDYTYSALDKVYSSSVLAIVLTGMGADGCKGAVQLKKSGSTIIAQEEKSCVVYGMPAAIVKAEIADKVLDLKGISDQIILHG